ncbi:transcription termination factor Rho [Nesterenkonia sandarakina]|uniref:Transcription termination factor Rho n=1 Tax=Nesterenkonia sandarakina TaxID=272918 RepID=A0A2T0YT79_9MICC|nr:transcription termination factor Rho [Nesterenkonia sandarakina]PRZ18967.1 transcription termination factor Rho [Nesterenkonia sandarakina]
MTETTAETTATQSAEKAESAAPEAKSSGLAGLKLAQLQALASQLGITGSSRMRKSALVEAISSHQRGGAVADKPQDQSSGAGRENDTAKSGNDNQAAGAQEPAAKRPNRRRSKAEPKATEAAAEQNGASAETAENAPSSEGARGENSREDTRDNGRNDQQANDSSNGNDDGGDSQPRGRNRNRRSRNRDENAATQQNAAQAEAQQSNTQQSDAQQSNSQSGSDEQSQDQAQDNGQRNDGEGRNRRSRGDNGRDNNGRDNNGRDGGRGNRDNNRTERNDGSRNDRNDGSRNDRSEGGRNDRSEGGRDGARNDGSRNERNDGTRNEGGRDEERRNRRSRNRNDRNDRNDRGDRNDRNDRNDRGDRNNRRRGRDPEVDDTEVTEDDVLVPVAGILDVLDNYAFVRTSGYLSGPNDVYVSLAQVKRHNLRKGDAVHGHIRAPREGENPQKRAKFNALVKLDAVNGRPPEANAERVEFSKLVPLYPQDRLRLEGDPKDIAPRVIDLIAPIGKGQRGLIVSPPKAGKTIILQALAKSIKANNPEVHLMMVLVDERPEEVTDMQRTVDGEVIASTFDRPADDHTTVAELAIERAKRLVELGKDVVVLLDSMTRLGRAYNTAAPASGRILSGGVDANALYPPKRFFGAARNIENGGSLTILATALVETGSKMDEVIFEEFKGTGNMELRLSRRLADKRIFPAVNVNESSTRREENLLSADEVKIMWKLRRVLSGLEQEQGLELLINKLKATQSNVEFLMLASKTALGDKGN